MCNTDQTNVSTQENIFTKYILNLNVLTVNCIVKNTNNTFWVPFNLDFYYRKLKTGTVVNFTSRNDGKVFRVFNYLSKIDSSYRDIIFLLNFVNFQQNNNQRNFFRFNILICFDLLFKKMDLFTFKLLQVLSPS